MNKLVFPSRPLEARPAAVHGIGKEGLTAPRIKSELPLWHKERDAVGVGTP